MNLSNHCQKISPKLFRRPVTKRLSAIAVGQLPETLARLKRSKRHPARVSHRPRPLTVGQ